VWFGTAMTDTAAGLLIDLPPAQIEVLLDQPEHDARVGAVSVMDWQARRRRTTADRRRDLCVVGGYLADRPRDPLYELARSPDWWERRTAIVATWFFIRRDDLDDTFALAEILVDDPVELVQKAVGGWVREAGKRDVPRLRAFLDRQAATMPRTILRYAIEHLGADEKRHYMGLGKATPTG
jgi:DNA alkylation repair enzyme